MPYGKRTEGSIMLTDHGRHYAQAEALFKKQDAHREESKAREEYEARQRAMQEKTARLRALRLARDQAKQRSASERQGTIAGSHPGKGKRAARFPERIGK
jgi:hypothetical protein